MDGFHIKGLFVNFIHHFWPSLVKRDGFLQHFVTPIVKATPTSGKKGRKEFYNLLDYRKWQDSLSAEEKKKWRVKYYKGLGTSTAEEGKQYFQNLENQRIDFVYQKESETDDAADRAIMMAFSKSLVSQRKAWLNGYITAGAGMGSKEGEQWLEQEQGLASTIPYQHVQKVSYKQFVDEELIQFSNADNIRNIPSVIDGLKPGQRKVLFACLRRNLVQEMKVAQLAGYVSETTAYHHGEASLYSTIINMASDYVGSNNVPLLLPIGQFGTRLEGGKDAASPRYIFTKLNPITRLIYMKEDEPLLQYCSDDGVPIEPVYFVPIIPMVLVNGVEGVGTGWSTKVSQVFVDLLVS